MLWLLLAVLFNVFFFVLFRLYRQYRVHSFQAITLNYWVCLLTGMVFSDSWKRAAAYSALPEWSPLSLLLGILFIVMFFLIARTAQQVSVSVASIAAKISMVVPVLLNLFVFGWSGNHGLPTYLGIGLALAAVVLSSKKREEAGAPKLGKLSTYFLPLAVFFGTGMVDSLLNYTNRQYLQTWEKPLFPMTAFAIAGLLGSLAVAYRMWRFREPITRRTIMGGILLGIPNYFSIYFLLLALDAFDNDGAVLFPLSNLLVILLSVGASLIIFREKLLKENKVGIALSLTAILLLAYQPFYEELKTLLVAAFAF